MYFKVCLKSLLGDIQINNDAEASATYRFFVRYWPGTKTHLRWKFVSRPTSILTLTKSSQFKRLVLVASEAVGGWNGGPAADAQPAFHPQQPFAVGATLTFILVSRTSCSLLESATSS